MRYFAIFCDMRRQIFKKYRKKNKPRETSVVNLKFYDFTIKFSQEVLLVPVIFDFLALSQSFLPKKFQFCAIFCDIF